MAPPAVSDDPAPAVHIEFTYTKGELRSMVRQNLERSSSFGRAAALSLVLLAVGGWGLLVDRDWGWTPLTAGLLLFAWGASSPARRVRKALKSPSGGPQRLDFTNEGVALEQGGVTIHSPWTGYERCLDLNDGVLLKPVDGAAHFVPRRAFPTPSDEQALLELIARHVRPDAGGRSSDPSRPSTRAPDNTVHLEFTLTRDDIRTTRRHAAVHKRSFRASIAAVLILVLCGALVVLAKFDWGWELVAAGLLGAVYLAGAPDRLVRAQLERSQQILECDFDDGLVSFRSRGRRSSMAWTYFSSFTQWRDWYVLKLARSDHRVYIPRRAFTTPSHQQQFQSLLKSHLISGHEALPSATHSPPRHQNT